MAEGFASFVILYNGHLSITEDFVPSYTGGQTKPLQVPCNTSLSVLKSRVMHSLKYDPKKFNVDLTCRIPVGEIYLASSVDDDDVCRVVMRQARTQFLVLYANVTPIATPSSSRARDSPSINPIVGITQDSGIPPYADIYECIPNDQNVGSSMPLVQTQSNDSGSSDDGYETMSSGSSMSSGDEGIRLENVNEMCEIVDNRGDLLRDYSVRTTSAQDDMTGGNEYLRSCRNTAQWDAETDADCTDYFDNSIAELKIPDYLEEGMCFASKVHLIFGLQGWSIANNVEYVVVASTTKVFTATCVRHEASDKPCKWRLHAAASKRLGGVWKLATLRKDHNCVNPILESGHRQCKSKFISYFILPVIRRQIDLKPREILGRMESKFNIRVSYMKAWDARGKALKAVFGSWEESYRSLFLFMEAINKSMPGSVYRIQSSSSARFERLFWSFQPCIVGWSYCRPVLTLDGTFLLGKYRGTLLTAIGIDANNGLFPLAFAVVESECNDSWGWFLASLKELLPEIAEREDLCFISDRHSGIVRACRELFPTAAHRSCLRHLRENFKKAIRKMGLRDIEFLCQKMYQAGNTCDVSIFYRNMEDIKTVKEEAYKWLIDRDVKRWSLIHDEGCRYGSMTTNAAESFNGVLKRARGLPIQALICSIFYNLVSIFLKRQNDVSHDESETNAVVSKVIADKLRNFEREARRMPEPIRINQHEFQVFDFLGGSQRVDILQDGMCRCQCGIPEMYHIPCSHVISCLATLRRSHYDYISPYYLLCNQKLTYSSEFHSIPERNTWIGYDLSLGYVPLSPPNSRRRSGRPRSTRYKNTMDESTSHNVQRRCSYCKMSGHNRTTCPRRI